MTQNSDDRSFIQINLVDDLINESLHIISPFGTLIHNRKEVYQPNVELSICHPHLDPSQRIVAENDSCYFLMHDGEQDVLVGSGVIVPKQHRATTFELTPTEWCDTYTLLHDAKSFLEETYGPDGYTLGWNVGAASNQTVPHAHLHIIPRYAGGPHAGKGLRHWLKRPE